MQIRFLINDKELTLQGLSIPEDEVISGQQMEYVARKRREGVLLQMFSLGGPTPQVQPTSSFIPVQVQQLLEKYKERPSQVCFGKSYFD